MMPCTHENAFLMGTAAGIRCRRCGQVFATFADIYPEPVPEAIPEETNEAPAPDPEASQEKPKRTRKKKGE